MPTRCGAACAARRLQTARHLCRAELERLQDRSRQRTTPLIVGCTQEAPLFSEVAEEADVTFVNLRETAGWSTQAAQAGPKMAALIAAAAEPDADYSLVSFESNGVALIYGRDEKAIEAAELLADHLDITVLITRPDNLAPPRVVNFPIVKGTITSAKGYLGAFELTVDDFAAAAPSSRGAMQFVPPRNGAVSHCDLILDLSGGAPLFPASDLRDGYLRADPGDPAAVLRSGAEGARSDRHIRQAALHQFYRRTLRALALEDRRLQPLSRSVPHRRDHAGRRSCRDRPAYLRGLRPMRRRVSDRRRRLCAAAGRRADAQAARHDDGLSRRRRQQCRRAAARRSATARR